MNSGVIILGTAVLAVLSAGYLAQRFLPPPKPKVVGIDLGTTYSCVGMYHAVSGNITVLQVQDGHKCIPSVVAFTDKGVSVGYHALSQAEHNPQNTIYDAKRFIGKLFSEEEVVKLQEQYPFKLRRNSKGFVNFGVVVNGTEQQVTPQDVGSKIIGTLKFAAENTLFAPVTKAVLSVPAEFDEMQRNYTILAGKLAGLDIFRVINEPTAAALAYGLHKKENLHNVLVVDLGGGTLDVSLLNVQGGMFLTQAMAGNNHLGGQDFNQRLLKHMLKVIEGRFGKQLSDSEDAQTLRLKVEEAKLNLTSHHHAVIEMTIHSFENSIFKESVTRQHFEDLNKDLFLKALKPIEKVLESTELLPEDVDEIVLVGGSTRIPRVIELVADYMKKRPNTGIDPEQAVVQGVSIQAGILGGMWPLTVSAVELTTRVKKVHVD